MFLNVDFIAMHRLRFMAGVGIVGSIITVVNILTFAKVWEDTFRFYGIPPVMVYTLFPIAYVGVCWYVGYIYDKKGLWKAETKFGNQKQNEDFLEVCDNVKCIMQHLELTAPKKKV